MGSFFKRQFWAVVASGVFLSLSVILTPYAGIQDDEALFTTPLFSNIGKEFRVRILHHDVSLMVMSYMGTLKTLIFAPIFQLFGENRWSLRLPVALLGAITVFIFYFLAERSAGRWAALLGALLLATDPVFILTNTFDWGPVALEHVLLVTACWSLHQFARQPDAASRRRCLYLGFFCLGLALWNKAIFLWALSGLVAGAVLVFWPEIGRLAAPRNLRAASAAFLIGASPLILYNIRHRGATLGQNAHFDLAIGPKWIQLESAFNGSSLFSYMVTEEWRPQPKPAQSALGRGGVWLRDRLGEHHRTGFYYVFGVLLAAVPLWWRSRAARFSLVFTTVTWLAMATTREAGGAAHHVILLWPFPVLFAAAALSSLASATQRFARWFAFAAAVGILSMNLVVLDQYLVQFERNGPAEVFTDAVYTLSNRVSAFANRPIWIIDWGVFNVLEFLHGGRLDLRVGSEPLMTDTPTEKQLHALRTMLDDREAVFISHVAGEEMFPKVNERLDRGAAEFGFHKVVLESIADSNGRPRFELFRFATQP